MLEHMQDIILIIQKNQTEILQELPQVHFHSYNKEFFR